MVPLSDFKIKAEPEEYQCQYISNTFQDVKNFNSNEKSEIVETSLKNDATCLKNVDFFSMKTENSATSITIEPSLTNFDNGFEVKFDPLASNNTSVKIEPTTSIYIIEEIGTPEEETKGWKTYPLLCCFCNRFPFLGIESLHTHIKTNHKYMPKKSMSYRCNDCEGVFSCYSIFLNHVLIDHHSDWKLCCDICDMTFKDYKNLSSHRQLHIKESDIGYPVVYLCFVCGRSFPKNYERDSHYKSSHRYDQLNNYFLCCICGTTFASQNSLNKHKKLHPKFRRKCKLCEVIFTTWQSLDEHTKEHYAPVKFKCDYCRKGFRRKVEKLKHERTHRKIEEKYACSQCKIKFTTMEKLRKHQCSHVHPYVCDKCKKSFPFLHKLQIHICEHKDERFRSRRLTHADVLAKAFY